jgi:hypothetical protein
MYGWNQHSDGGTQRSDDFVRRAMDTRRPFLLDSISSGRAPRSSSWLLRLPSHILADIVAYVAMDEQGSEALALLALVNSDCLQLARSQKFTEIRANASPRSTELFEELEREAAAVASDQMDNDNPDLGERPLRIGVCVRRLTFGPELSRNNYNQPLTHPFIMGVHGLDVMGGTGFDESPGVPGCFVNEYGRFRQAQAQAEARGEARMSMVMRSLPAMSNLNVIVWENGHHVDRTFFEHISRTPAKHVQLNEMFLREPALLLESRLPDAWPLVTLDIQLLDDPFTHFCSPSDRPTSLQFQTIFQLCAPTLESLIWRYGRSSVLGQIIHLQPIHFPRLAHLDMTNVVPDASTLSHLLTSPVLRRLVLPAQGWTRELAAGIEHHRVSQLQSLSVPGIPQDPVAANAMIAFLMQNRYISTLRVGESVPGVGHDETVFSSRFLQLLGRFHSLTRLVVTWAGATPPQPDGEVRYDVVLGENVLQSIGSLTNLKYLSLGVSGMHIDVPEWRIDHDAIHGHLCKLVHLRVLALHQDSYPVQSWLDDSPLNTAQYYDLQITGARVVDDAKARPWLDNSDPLGSHSGGHGDDLVWERAHRNRMLTQGETYARAMPSLTWVFCGQRWMMLHRRSGGEVQAQPLSRERFPDQQVGSAMTWLEDNGWVSDRE